MCSKPFVKLCIFVVIQIFWSLCKFREQYDDDDDDDDDATGL